MSLVHLHLMLSHVPVIGIPLVVVVLLAALWRRNSDMAKLALVLLAGIAAVTAVVFLTGEPSEEVLENVAGVSERTIHEHEESGEIAFVATGIAGAAALAMLWWFRRRELPRWIVGLALGVTLVLSGMMAWTANLGGAIRHTEIGASAGGEAGREKPDEQEEPDKR